MLRKIYQEIVAIPTQLELSVLLQCQLIERTWLPTERATIGCIFPASELASAVTSNARSSNSCDGSSGSKGSISAMSVIR